MHRAPEESVPLSRGTRKRPTFSRGINPPHLQGASATFTRWKPGRSRVQDGDPPRSSLRSSLVPLKRGTDLRRVFASCSGHIEDHGQRIEAKGRTEDSSRVCVHEVEAARVAVVPDRARGLAVPPGVAKQLPRNALGVPPRSKTRLSPLKGGRKNREDRDHGRIGRTKNSSRGTRAVSSCPPFRGDDRSTARCDVGRTASLRARTSRKPEFTKWKQLASGWCWTALAGSQSPLARRLACPP